MTIELQINSIIVDPQKLQEYYPELFQMINSYLPKKKYKRRKPRKQIKTVGMLIDEIQEDGFLAEFEGRNQSIDLDELKELSESNPVKSSQNCKNRCFLKVFEQKLSTLKMVQIGFRQSA